MDKTLETISNQIEKIESLIEYILDFGVRGLEFLENRFVPLWSEMNPVIRRL